MIYYGFCKAGTVQAFGTTKMLDTYNNSIRNGVYDVVKMPQRMNTRIESIMEMGGYNLNTIDKLVISDSEYEWVDQAVAQDQLMKFSYVKSMLNILQFLHFDKEEEYKIMQGLKIYAEHIGERYYTHRINDDEYWDSEEESEEYISSELLNSVSVLRGLGEI